MMIGDTDMAININTGNLTSPQYSTYKIEKFNGVDYTTSPTKVDGTRAIDMSNYLPMGNSLVKRYGIEKIKDAEQGVLNQKTVFYNGTWIMVQLANDMDVNDIYIIDIERDCIVSHKSIYHIETVQDYLECVVLEGKLFILTSNSYLVYDAKTFEITDVTNVAYVPTLLLGLNSNYTAMNTLVYEPLNLLSKRFKVTSYFDTRSDFNGTRYIPKSNIYSLKGHIDKRVKLVSINGATYSGEWDAFEIPIDARDVSESTSVGDLTKLYVYYLQHDADSERPSYSDELTFTLKQVNEGDNPAKELKEPMLKIEFVFELEEQDSTLVTHATKMIKYGVQQGDSLFFGCNSLHPNVDVHTSIIENTEEPWKKYTYVPDNSYQAFGDSNTAVIGYGILNNGSMIIVKESIGNEPNVYTRSGQYYTETRNVQLTTLDEEGKLTYFNQPYEITDVRYPTFITGCYVNATKDSKMVYYDNKVFISNEDGVYNIVLNDSTATQTYGAYEFSYSIKANLSRDISHSDAFVYDNRLFIYRKDKNGKYRLYVADKSRYLYHNDKLQYEWWVLDGFGDESRFSVESGDMYFLNKYGTYKYNNSRFIDSDSYELNVVSVNNELQSTQAFIDSASNFLILGQDARIFDDVHNAIDKKKAYEQIIENNVLKFDLPDVLTLGKVIQRVEDEDTLYYPYRNDDELEEVLQMLLMQTPIIYNTTKFVCESYNLTTLDDGELINVVEIKMPHSENHALHRVSFLQFDISGCKERFRYHISDMYAPQTEGSITHYYSVKHCVYSDGRWIYLGEKGNDYVELTSALFNFLKVSINGIEYRFGEKTLSKVKIETNKVVQSSWYSSYIVCERLDYLKTASNIYFVPDPIRGGYTHIGYRTSKKDVEYMTYALSDEFDFDDLDFADMTYAQTTFGRTYSSKKKIKNFSFLQLKMYSNDNKDSSVNALAFRYKYSKQNKGVR